MDKKITPNLVLSERTTIDGVSDHSMYIPAYFIDSKLFEATITQMGGHVYNVSVGQIGAVVIFNGLTWLSISGTSSDEESDMWAKRFEQTLLEEIHISPIYIHHPDKAGFHTWGIEFNREQPFWEAPAGDFVKEARNLLASNLGWFYQCGCDSPDKGYQFFEYLGSGSIFSGPEMVVREAAIKIAKELGTIVFV